jgi:hypothetical protein
MTTSIGEEDPDITESGIDDEAHVRKDDPEGEGAIDTERDVTAEDIARGDDRNVSADQGNRSGTTNKLKDDGIDLGR